jgi:hypothetical protein
VITEPFPDLPALLAQMGEAGARVSAIEASEGAAGNISICVRWPIEVRNLFPLAEPFELPRPAPELGVRRSSSAVPADGCVSWPTTRPRRSAAWCSTPPAPRRRSTRRLPGTSPA